MLTKKTACLNFKMEIIQAYLQETSPDKVEKMAEFWFPPDKFGIDQCFFFYELIFRDYHMVFWVLPNVIIPKPQIMIEG